MNSFTWISYLFEASLALCLLFVIFKIGYERLGHYYLNRIFLTLGLLLALAVPAIHIPISLEVDAAAFTGMEMIPLDAISNDFEVFQAPKQHEAETFNWSLIAFGGYVVLVLCFFLLKTTQVAFLNKKLRVALPSSLAHHIFITDSHSSFSFGRKIFLGEDYKQLSQKGRDMMLKHEQAHIDQKHRIDLLFFHIAHCLLWFHPLMPAWGRALRQQHEYLADQASVRQFQDPKAYARLLLTLSTGTSSPYTHAFAFFTLKKRITMLFKTSSKASKWSYALLIPLLGCMLCSFSFDQNSALQPEEAYIQIDDNIPSLKPVDAEIVSGFGMRYNPLKKAKKHHRGIDIRADIGAPVYPPANGTVSEVVDHGDKGYGKLLTIDHGNGFVTRYAHLSAFEVKQGDQVRRGEVIAKVGNTGMSLGPHLHSSLFQCLSLRLIMKIAIIGAGNMGLTYAQGFIHTSIVKPAQLFFIDRSQRRMEEISKLTSNPVRNTAERSLVDMDLIILAVKPQDFDNLAIDLRDYTHPGQLILSIMAGKSIETIRNLLGTPKVIRAMPNLPSQVGQGMTVFTTTPDVSRAELLTVHNLLNTTGKTLYVDNEGMVDAATAISGSGPGYVFYLMSSMMEVARQMGFSDAEAQLLVTQTFQGSVDLLNQEDISCDDWVKRVASKGGTTEAALRTFERRGLIPTLELGLTAAFERAIELST